MHCVLVCNDPEERDLLQFSLRQQGLSVQSHATVSEALRSLSDEGTDVLLMVEEQGAVHDAIQAVREESQIPLIVLLDTTEAGHIDLLKLGADLVLARNLSSRLAAHYALRLARRANAVPSHALPRLDLNQMVLEPETRSVQVEDRDPVRLTQLEFRLLYALMTHRGQVLPTEVIVERVWGYSGEGNRELVRGLISRLRHKIEHNPNQPRLIETLPGIGYRFSLEVE